MSDGHPLLPLDLDHVGVMELVFAVSEVVRR